ncbi:MAG: hypothetical protein IKI04_01535, partial [Bacilli bacterium]|nr:hypothetical protein [Bacilli bacterium]
AIDESVTVYSVTLTKGTGVSAVSGSGNYISGSTVTLGATMSANYTWVNWTQSGTINQISATQAYSAAITSNWSYTANATQTFAATICPVGSYVITQGSTCAVCPVGTTSTVTDATSCTTTCSNISNVSSWSVPIGGTLTTYSKTSNFNDDGSVNGTRLSAATDGITDTVTIDGSLALHVSIRYLFDRFTMIKSYCRVCLFMPDTPINNTGYGSMSNECDSSVSGALWANSETTSQYDITGDTAVMYYKCAMSAPDQYGYYGYYAVISGTSVKDNCKINSCETGYLLTENKCLSASPSTASAPNVVAKYVSNDNNYTSGSWTNQEVYLNISSSANDTAITDFQYSLDNGNNWNSLSCTIIQNDTTYSCNKTWDIETYLDNTIIFRGIDSATRLTSNSNTINIKYDQKKPSGGLTVEISEGNNNATISASGNYRDNESGLATTNTYGWSIISENASCNSSVSFVSTTSNTYTFNVTSEGGYQVCLRVLDKVGNANYSSKKIYYTKWRMANGSVQIPDASTCVNRCLEYCQFYLGSTYTIWSCNDETAFLSCDSTSMSHCPTAYDTSGTKCWCRY